MTHRPEPVPAPAHETSMSAAELAARTASTPDRIGRLVEIGVLRPQGEAFVPADIQRVAIVDAYERSGIALEELARAIDERRMSFEFTDRIYPEASPPSGRTVGDLAASLGDRAPDLFDLFVALGLPRPEAGRTLSVLDEQILPRLIDAWTGEGMAPDALPRAARLIGNSTRRVTEGWVELFLESIGLTPAAAAMLTLDDLRTRMFEPAMTVAQVLEPTVVWLLRRHMEQSLTAVNIEAMERALEATGARAQTTDPPAIIFADLSGFTQLTEEHGDEIAVRHAEALAAIATDAAATHDGRFVKQLGDGVMLAFERPSAAVAAATQIRAAAVGAGLPPVHVGVSAGPVIGRDGDYYGRTVNLASRLSGVAGPGEIVLDESAASHLGGRRLTSLGHPPLKGISAAVAAFRLDD